MSSPGSRCGFYLVRNERRRRGVFAWVGCGRPRHAKHYMRSLGLGRANYTPNSIRSAQVMQQLPLLAVQSYRTTSKNDANERAWNIRFVGRYASLLRLVTSAHGSAFNFLIARGVFVTRPMNLWSTPPHAKYYLCMLANFTCTPCSGTSSCSSCRGGSR